MKVVTETRGGYVIRGRVDRSKVLAGAAIGAVLGIALIVSAQFVLPTHASTTDALTTSSALDAQPTSCTGASGYIYCIGSSTGYAYTVAMMVHGDASKYWAPASASPSALGWALSGRPSSSSGWTSSGWTYYVATFVPADQHYGMVDIPLAGYVSQASLAMVATSALIGAIAAAFFQGIARYTWYRTRRDGSVEVCWSRREVPKWQSGEEWYECDSDDLKALAKVLAKAGPEMLVVINTTPSALQTQQNDQSPH